MKNIIISDYDQTLYINDEDIEKNKELIKQFRKKGNIFVIATGRSYLDFKNKVNKYNFEYDFVILNHGATILDRNDNIIHNFAIDNKIIQMVKKDVNLENSIENFCCSALESRVEFEHNDLTKIYVKYENKEIAMKYNELINSKYNHYVNSYYVTINSVEIISNKTNKAKAIQLLLNNIEDNFSSINVIGDGYSDIEMVRDFNGYCMKDSVEELKIVAKREYNSVSELVTELL